MNKTQRNQVWETRVSDFKTSGLTMSAWCIKYDLTLHQLKYWLRIISKRTNSVPAVSSTNWIPIVVTPSPQVLPLVVQVGQACIQVGAGFDADLLRQVVRALEVPC